MLFSSSHFPLIWLTRTRSTRGRNVTQEMIFHSLEAYVDDTVTGQYYAWTEQDLGPDRYVQITGISFDFWGDDIITEFPVDIPEDADTIVICVSYRLSLDDEEWTPVKGEFWGFELPGVSYTLLTGRTVVLGEKLESEGAGIAPEDILNRGNQYPEDYSGVLNLMAYQQGIFGKENKVLTKLFPGWKENGELVSFMYPITVGRHVLEPAAGTGGNAVPLEFAAAVGMGY